MSTAKKMPKYGWVRELENAESAAKKSRSAGAQLRLAIAAYKLRDFKKLKAAANLGLALDPSEGEKKLLKEYVGKSKEQKESMLERKYMKPMYEPDGCCDIFGFSSNTVLFTNLNILHYAVLTGDITLMEEVVALGAALDFPVRDTNVEGIPPVPAPPRSTALVLACALLAMYGDLERLDPNLRRVMPAKVFDELDGICECAIQLVYLGADCQIKLQIPAQRRDVAVNPLDPVIAYRELNFSGKTVQELASISDRRELIRAVELMQTSESIDLTQCRCGSRLPWNQCHGAPVPGQSNLYIQDTFNNGRLAWRYSPKAMCPCNLTNKAHYKCCWFSSAPCYKDDISGDVARMELIPDSDNAQALRQLQQTMISEGMDPTGPTGVAPEDMTAEEYRAGLTDFIRSEGFTVLSDINGRRSGVKDWDPMVYAGVVDRFAVDKYFMWNDLHWRLPKAELLQRTKEWNEALEKYCDDTDLTGAEREAVIQKHTGNPCAPCSNPSCNNWETEPKQFKACSQCQTVAYCSRDCQKIDWKAQHKSKCFSI
jgi:hypothetical protein